tara:strand:+ start:407 stop:841 length:435 start_codon:yes stop_codon:yes gene_type:complete
MSPIKRAYLIIAIIIPTIIFFIAYFDSDNLSAVDTTYILEQIEFNAIYDYEEHIVKITFIDRSNNTKSAILEVLGMNETYHKEYVFNNESSFVAEFYLEYVPKYGWETTPITLEIQHSQFGTIGLKTEIVELGNEPAKIIVERK